MAIPAIDHGVLEKLCEVLADTSSGLTGSEIGKHLATLGITDPLPEMTKRVRLFEALKARQAVDRCGNSVIAFVQAAMNPVRHTDARKWFESKQSEINTVLAFAGLELHANGVVGPRKVATTLDEAQQRTQKLRHELLRRGVHADVLKFCTPELLAEDYFHAVQEASKSIADKLRSMTGSTKDGTELAEQVLSVGSSGMPVIAFNSLRTLSETSEQKGLLNLAKGVFGTFRNTTAHEARIHWNVSEQDAFDLMTIASYLHRRLDSAAPTGRPLP
jgi:uncharacterized protein (TIGR02391 family)